MRWINLIKMTIALFAVGLVMGACQGGAPAEPGTAPEASVPAASEAPIEATPTTVEVGHEFWFAGFHVDLGSASFDPTQELVTVDATFENLGSEPAVFDGTPSLAAGGAL